MSKKTIGFLVGFFFLTGTLHARDIWLQTHGAHLELLYGDGLPEVYNPAKVKEFSGFDKKGHAVPLRRILMDESFAFLPDPQVAMITMAFDDGYWVQASTSDWRNVSLEVAKTFPSYRHAMFFHKSIYAWSRSASKPLHQKMEVVALKDPFGKHSYQDMLLLQVYFDGKPLPGATVEYSQEGGKPGQKKTDANGKVKVPYAKRPVQYVVARYTPAAAGPEAMTYTASLRFELKS